MPSTIPEEVGSDSLYQPAAADGTAAKLTCSADCAARLDQARIRNEPGSVVPVVPVAGVIAVVVVSSYWTCVHGAPPVMARFAFETGNVPVTRRIIDDVSGLVWLFSDL
jgi:hypothetical protein